MHTDLMHSLHFHTHAHRSRITDFDSATRGRVNRAIIVRYACAPLAVGGKLNKYKLQLAIARAEEVAYAY